MSPGVHVKKDAWTGGSVYERGFDVS